MKASEREQGPARVCSARRADLEGIMEIERSSFSHPWSRETFLEEFENDLSRIKVLREPRSKRVIAFINYWVVHDEIHVLNVATHPDWRRQGLARRLMLHVQRDALKRGSVLITLEARRSNHSALQLYDELGFLPVGVRPRYYENSEDAIVMVKNLR
jgi:[ribosomal protein S18]-alanine N-acetyltransferase